MKKTFLNLRKMGFVLVAACSMLAFSCGEGEETTDDADATEETTDEEDVVEESCGEGECDGADTCDDGDTTEMACEEGACEEGACEDGE